MNQIIKTIFVVLGTISALVLMLNLQTFANSGKFLKEDIEIALHDASLALNAEKLANGYVVFDLDRAKSIFHDSFQRNTGIKEEDYSLLEFEVFDEDNASFPFTYNARNVQFSDTFNDPTIFAVVEVEAQKYYFGNIKDTVRKAASYSYRPKNNEAVQAARAMLSPSGSSFSCLINGIDKGTFLSTFENAGLFSGMGDVFIEAAQKHNVDPVLLAAIAWHETGGGNSTAVKNYNNPGGLMNPKTDSLFHFDSLEVGIDAMASVLQRLYISKGLVTIEQIGAKYAPIGVSNDPTGLNNHWVPAVKELVDKFGGMGTVCEEESFVELNVSTNDQGFVWPVPFTNRITSEFNPNRIHPIKKVERPHNGIDIADTGIENQNVLSTKDGTVTYSGFMSGYGEIVIIKHDGGLETRYAHLNTTLVKKGDEIKAGTIIGKVGNTGDSTGPHLHFETRVNSKPVDPMLFFTNL